MAGRRMALLGALAIVTGLAALARSQGPDFSKVEIKTEKLTDGLFMLQGAGGNIGVSAGSDGVVLIDDEYAPLTEKVLAAVKAINPQPVRFVVNTHWHGDHSGGNENLGKAGALIVAHENVRRRMSTDQFIKLFNWKAPASPKVALPVVTFGDDMTLHLNGDEVHAVHVPPAHTDGDALVHFKKANVLHMGDLYFNGMYPFVDLDTGGSVEGMIAAADRALKMADARTRIIPGHGPLGDAASLRAYRDVMVTVRDRIKPMVSAGKTVADLKAAAPTKDLDAKWGQGFMKGEQFAETVFRSYGGK
jgi:cyclase